MYTPAGMSEPQVLAKLDHVVNLLAHSFVFGYYDLEDIKQEARIFGLEALPRYDPGSYDAEGEPARKLENFLFSHIKNRLLNFLRDRYHRNDPPCTLCHQGRQHEHADQQICGKYRTWKARNSAKANLMRPLTIDHIADEHESNMRQESSVQEDAEVREATRLIDNGLPAELRSDYLRMKAGENIAKGRRAQIEKAIRELLKGFLDHAREEA